MRRKLSGILIGLGVLMILGAAGLLLHNRQESEREASFSARTPSAAPVCSSPCSLCPRVYFFILFSIYCEHSLSIPIIETVRSHVNKKMIEYTEPGSLSYASDTSLVIFFFPLRLFIAAYEKQASRDACSLLLQKCSLPWSSIGKPTHPFR